MSTTQARQHMCLLLATLPDSPSGLLHSERAELSALSQLQKTSVIIMLP